MSTLPLFERYSSLRTNLPWVSLAELPTPVAKLEHLGRLLGSDSLYVKRDDLSGSLYGGNKPRKLEFLLAQAVESGAREVLTFGCAGSNHALATAIYARELGLRSISMLMPQPNARYVRRNLLAGSGCGEELHACGSRLQSRLTRPLVYLSTAGQVMSHRLQTGRRPYLISPGGSSPLGTVGYVNAALELSHQVSEGLMPQPEVVFVACGTMGTAAGLILGLMAAGMSSRVVCVQVTGSEYVNAAGVASLVNRTSAFLHSLDSSFPSVRMLATDVDIRTGYLGPRYAEFTEQGMHAVALMKDTEGIILEGTYTGKTLAALIDEVRSSGKANRTVLFWNTVNSRDLSPAAESVDYRDLPHAFHRYFEEDVQPLDHDVAS